MDDSTLALPRKPRRGDLVELQIERLDARGQGEADQRVSIGPGGAPRTLTYSVRRALPGDHVTAHIRRILGNRFEASVEVLRQPAPNRIEPRCSYFPDRVETAGCGGCALQSLAYEDQLIHKAARVTALTVAAGAPPGSLQPAIPARSPWYYRNKMEFSFGVDFDGTYALGMHPAGRRYDVLPLDTCYLQSEASAILTRAIRAWGETHGVPHHDQRRELGFLRTMTIREGKRTGDRLIELTTSPATTAHYDGEERPAEDVVADFLATLLATAEREELQVTSVVWTRHIAVKGQRTRVEHTHLHGPETLSEALHIEGAPPMRFQIHPRAFFQPNTLQAEVLYAEVIRATGLHDGAKTARVMDLYCGTGTIGLAMAHAAKEVIGIELSPEAVASARTNAERNQVDNITFYQGDVGEVLEAQGLAEPGAVDVVVVDPPRAGLLPSALQQLLRLGAPRLVYVSCNPSALAKNLRDLLAAGWSVESIRPVDMFPQTAHIETIAVLQRSAS
jgi:23S rRNA (uracil1939-C5)-methyltransferase